MEKNYDFVKPDSEVWWNDPDGGRSSGKYVIQQINASSDEPIKDDTIILIDNGYTEAEVRASELSTLDERRLEMKAFGDRICDIIQGSGWWAYAPLYNNLEASIEFYTHLPLCRDFSFAVYCPALSLAMLEDSIKEYVDCFDIDYETHIWIGSDGHGKNGAPYHIEDIIENNKKVKIELDNLYGIICKTCKDEETN